MIQKACLGIQRIKVFLQEVITSTGKSCHIQTLKGIFKRHRLVWKRYRKSLKPERDEVLFEFFKSELSYLEQQAKQGIIDLIFMDESGFNLNPNVPYGWQPIGQQILLPAKRSSTNWTVLGTLNIHSQSFYGYMMPEACTAKTVVEVLSNLSERINKKTIVILDNAPVHKAKIVKEKLVEWRKKGLYLQFIPAYSPELNKIEILWRQMKYYWLEPNDYQSQNTLYQKIIEILQNYGSKYSISFS
ncbi:IS630 family transposase [Chondrinema litorale]|uniref:IS630 family transposase n=1 Tax=Chondrinema litorale TaxID=2994555 RepID=UPI00254292CC|nr:IS630 family transposase [Chondrinema litorale]UZR96699.1 IS630 family transposase [Chondrinema litorale]UZR97135.1 IS630 family transposase [Chondrinema litorale]UZR97318.1 IS630 family transposase [Chondrinema litorale]UZR97726.1 IS630 family transposase [Chondrinema litorale]